MSEEQENKELYSTKITDGDKISVSDEGVKIGDVAITHYHGQDCCEQVYADWGQLKNHVDEMVKKNATKLTIKGVSGIGFLLVLEKNDYNVPYKVFVPCYNVQNGYYSDELELRISQNDVTAKIDIGGFVDSHYD